MTLADRNGPYFGEFGGRFVAESLMGTLEELDSTWQRLWHDPRRRQCSLASLTSLIYDGDALIDIVYSENSYGFHAPDYTQRILSQALDAARKGQLALQGLQHRALAERQC